MDEFNNICKRLAQIFEEVMECPVCFGTMDASLKQCVNGHGVCSSCARRIEKCPSCQQGLVVRRNVLLSRLLESFPRPCPNIGKGCKTMISNKEHETFCEFRMTKCLKKTCTWEGCVKYLTSHVKTCTLGRDVLEIHGANSDEKLFFTINHPKRKFLMISPIIFHGQLFWKYFVRDGSINRFSYAFHHVAASKPKCSYSFIISFKKNGVTYFTHCCKATTDFDEKFNSVHESGFTIPIHELERFRQPKSNNFACYLKVITEDYK